MKSTHTSRIMSLSPVSAVSRLKASSPIRTLRRARVGFAVLLLAAGAASCGSDDEISGLPSTPGTQTYASTLNVNIASMTKLSDNLFVKDSVVGAGVDVVAGKTITTTYSGYLVNGALFDSGTITFVIGVGSVIPGWDQGIPGMKVGTTRKLVIGSTLGYGATGSGIIPPNATLIFNVTVTAVK